MPRDDALHYFVPGAFDTHTISCMSHMSHTRAANSSHMYPRPYPSALSLIKRIDQVGDGWYGDCADDLHLRDFIWFARMQTTRCMSISGRQPRGGDQVLEQLLEEETFDQVEPNVPNVVEEFCMAHSAAMDQRLLVRIEGLERRVHLSGPLYPKLSTCFEGARLTQLVQLVTADRLFPCHEGQVDP